MEPARRMKIHGGQLVASLLHPLRIERKGHEHEYVVVILQAERPDAARPAGLIGSDSR